MTAQLKILVLVAAAAVLLAPVASARKPGKNFKNAVFRGTVESVLDDRVIVLVGSASRWGRRAEGQSVAFAADENTRIRAIDLDDDGNAEVSDFRPSDRIHVIAHVPEEEEAESTVRVYSGIQLTISPASP